MSEGVDGAVPILRAKTGRRYSGPQTLRYNPRTKVATLSITAWNLLGWPTTIGLYYDNLSNRLYLVGNATDEEVARRISKKRTFVVTYLRDLVGEASRKWIVEWDQVRKAFYVQLERPVEVES